MLLFVDDMFLICKEWSITYPGISGVISLTLLVTMLLARVKNPGARMDWKKNIVINIFSGLGIREAIQKKSINKEKFLICLDRLPPPL